jgi:hypothetical protein
MSVLWIGHHHEEAFPHTHACGCPCEQGGECNETHDCPECRAKEAATYHFAPQVFPCLCCERASTPENPVSYMPECQMFACADCQREFAVIAENFEAVCR